MEKKILAAKPIVMKVSESLLLAVNTVMTDLSVSSVKLVNPKS